MVSKLGRFSFSSTSVEMKAPDDPVAAERQADLEVARLQGELDTLKAALADREAALALAASDAQQARDQWQQDLTARIAAAETQSRQQSARSALADVTAACDAAQQASEQSSQNLSRQDHPADGSASPQPADREVASHQAPATGAVLEDAPRPSKIVIRTNRLWAADVVDEARRVAKERATGGIVAAAALGMLTVAALITGGNGNPATRGSSQDLAVALRDVNVRAAPSTEAKILSTLSRGVKVAMIEERGSWHLVRIEGNSGETRSRQGWVYASFLKREPPKPR
jgi:SH3 domain-containing protein